MKTYKNLWKELRSYENLYLAYKKARKHKTTKEYVIEFEKSLENNLFLLRSELLLHSYEPKSLVNFICDSYANRKGKGTLKAIQRFDCFKREISKNYTINCYVLKADIKKYFENIDHTFLLNILKRKIKDEKVLWLIKRIIKNYSNKSKGIPLGNLTSQFFANVYLNELDWFIKSDLKAKYYIRYVDDFVILHSDKNVLLRYKDRINQFLKQKLNIELHPDKSKIIRLKNTLNFLVLSKYILQNTNI